jgi:hypothetical protein
MPVVLLVGHYTVIEAARSGAESNSRTETSVDDCSGQWFAQKTASSTAEEVEYQCSGSYAGTRTCCTSAVEVGSDVGGRRNESGRMGFRQTGRTWFDGGQCESRRRSSE